MKKRLLLFMLLGISVIGITGCGKSVEEYIDDNVEDVEKEVSLGEWTENTYKNDFLGITYEKPADWSRHSDEEIKSAMEIGLENVEGSELSKKLAELTSITYMITSKSNGTNVILMSEKPLVSLGLESYSKTLKNQLEAQTAVSYTVEEITTEEINGKSFSVLKANVSGIKQNYYIYKKDKHFVSIIVTLTGTDSSDDILKRFTFE